MTRITFLIDLGTGTTKIQTSDAKAPKYFPTIAARPRIGDQAKYQPKDQNDYIFDHEIRKFKGILQMVPLISPYYILKPRPFREFLTLIFGQLDQSTENANLVVGVPSSWSSDVVSEFKSILFQTFGFHSIFCAPSELFGLYYYNLENCTLLDSGYDTSRILHFRNKELLSTRIQSTPIAGSAISKYLQVLLKTRFPKITNKKYSNYLELIKETKRGHSDTFY